MQNILAFDVGIGEISANANGDSALFVKRFCRIDKVVIGDVGRTVADALVRIWKSTEIVEFFFYKETFFGNGIEINHITVSAKHHQTGGTLRNGGKGLNGDLGFLFGYKLIGIKHGIILESSVGVCPIKGVNIGGFGAECDGSAGKAGSIIKEVVFRDTCRNIHLAAANTNIVFVDVMLGGRNDGNLGLAAGAGCNLFAIRSTGCLYC